MTMISLGALNRANAAVHADTPLERQAQLAGDGRTIVLKADALAPLLNAAYESPDLSAR